MIAFHNVDEPGVILCAGMPALEQLFEHDRDLHAIGRAERIKLEWMFPHGQVAFGTHPGGRTIDTCKAAAALIVKLPDLGWGVGRIGHAVLPPGLREIPG